MNNCGTFSEDMIMRGLSILLSVLLLSAGLVYAEDRDVTAPEDTVVGFPAGEGAWPANEAPQYLIDNNTGTKYLHFNFDTANPSGLVITPVMGATTVRGIRFASANDAAERDPMSYRLEGSNDDGTTWTLIATGSIPDFADPAWPRLTWTTTPMVFSNETTYLSYRLTFLTVRGNGTLFQLAEAELLGTPINGWPADVTVTPAVTVIRLPENTLAIDATVTDVDSETWTCAWTQISGPAAVDFGGTEAQEDATVTFPQVRGTYTLQLNVTDDKGNKSIPRNVTVRMWNPAVDDVMISHWKFDEADGSTVANDSALDNDKGYLGNYNSTHHDPNFVPGWVTLPDAAANNAAEFLDAGYIEVFPDANSVGEPNMMSLDYGVSVAAWVYATDWTGNRRICQFGNPTGSDEANIFRLLREGGGMRFVASALSNRMLTVPIFPAAEWHHVAGTYDGKTIKIYIDGALAGTQEYSTYAALYPYQTQTLCIGAKNKNVNFESYPGDYMKGKLDDLRVYSYAIDRATVRSLVELGQNSAPAIDAINVPAEIILTAETVDVDIDADIYDAHGDTITYKWMQVAGTPAVVFSSTTVEDPTVTVSKSGTYTLRLTINDGVYGMSGAIYKDVTIVVTDANCEKVKIDGLLLAGDINEDCRVNINDFALMALDWLRCNDPQDINCDNPYAAQ